MPTHVGTFALAIRHMFRKREMSSGPWPPGPVESTCHKIGPDPFLNLAHCGLNNPVGLRFSWGGSVDDPPQGVPRLNEFAGVVAVQMLYFIAGLLVTSKRNKRLLLELGLLGEEAEEVRRGAQGDKGTGVRGRDVVIVIVHVPRILEVAGVRISPKEVVRSN